MLEVFLVVVYYFREVISNDVNIYMFSALKDAEKRMNEVVMDEIGNLLEGDRVVVKLLKKREGDIKDNERYCIELVKYYAEDEA